MFEFDHDRFASSHVADGVVDYLQRLLRLDSPTLANIASHMRFIDRNTGAQWWILEMNDNQGHRVRTDV